MVIANGFQALMGWQSGIYQHRDSFAGQLKGKIFRMFKMDWRWWRYGINCRTYCLAHIPAISGPIWELEDSFLTGKRVCFLYEHAAPFRFSNDPVVPILRVKREK
jgi:hypothetical protein